ncbi:hypothetical protein KIW84_033824 [Lathyrus oleraceus]|uniref:Uncharacterized protein n=1 Tax=Pisum sativum TaxID=3888 RepID=A0A9D4Y2E1_PEA|nr:hypothetical protein KIW84_033824 [Pisum sativum]
MQALIRGHLVRRQAVSALYCVKRIVKVQALARGYNVRRADIGLEVLKIRKDTQCSKSIGSVTSTEAEKLPDNVFVHKLLAASSHAFPLSIRSDFGEPHLAENWLDRWTSSQTVEKGQVKRNTRKSSTVKANDGSTSGSNKQKQGLKKDSKHSLVSAQKPNTWIGGTRLRVAIGTVYCLQHMHQLNPPLAHSSLNTSSVQLTDDYAAKISDLSLLKEIASLLLLDFKSIKPIGITQITVSECRHCHYSKHNHNLQETHQTITVNLEPSGYNLTALIFSIKGKLEDCFLHLTVMMFPM